MLFSHRKLLKALLLDGAVVVALLCTIPCHSSWVTGKIHKSFAPVPKSMEDTSPFPSAKSPHPQATSPAQSYSGMMDLTDALGPKVAAFNQRQPPSERIQLLAKTEFLNPASQSHKDRIARAMIVKAEERGELTDNQGNKKTILAASSGNSGHALAVVGTAMGYKVVIITNNKCSEEKCENIRRSGAELWMAEDLPSQFPNALKDIHCYMEQERQLVLHHPDRFFSINQYENHDNMMAHYEATAQEIWKQSQGRVTHFVMAASTGGTIMGVGKYLKERKDVRVILSDPHKSHLAGLLEQTRGNVAKGNDILRRVEEALQREGPIQVEGAGKNGFTKIMTQGGKGSPLQYVDEVIPIHDFDAFDMCRKIASRNGIKIGGSAGLNVAACQRIAERCVEEGRGNVVITTLLCDDGNKYQSKIFNDEWIQANDPRPRRESSLSTPHVPGTGTPEVGYRLDPTDWDSYRSQMHGLLDQCMDRMQSYRDLPWQPPPSDLRQRLKIDTNGIGAAGQPLPDVIDQLTHDIMPYATGNTHPQFMGWVHGAGLPSSVAADLVSSVMNSNCGGRNQGAADVEVSCIEWLCQTAGFAMSASFADDRVHERTPFGVLTGGTSQATIYALLAARTKLFGNSIRKSGIQGMAPVRVYVSEAAHSCITRTMECLGHGSDCVVRIPIDPHTGSMQIDSLNQLLKQDKASGMLPLAIVGTAGSVTVGAYDDFGALADLAAEYNTWLHVDAAFGFWTRLATDSKIRDLTNNIHRADSIALDTHKWPGVNYACGALLVRDKKQLRETLASRPAYLQSASEGLAGGDTWFTDYSLDLSRGFSALKVWTALKVAGSDAIGKTVTDHCRLADYMGQLVGASPFFELAHPVISNICCFYIKPLKTGGGPTVAEIAAELQVQGKGVFSTIALGDKQCLRAAIVNHRTTPEDVAKMVAAAEDAVRSKMQLPDRVPEYTRSIEKRNLPSLLQSPSSEQNNPIRANS